MFRKCATAIVTIVLMTGSAPLAASDTASGSITFAMHVPVACKLRHRPIGVGMSGDTANLGELDEYCNAPSGYQVTVDYTPGSLRGTVLAAGNDRVILDGSGHAVLSRAAGPLIRQRQLTAMPGANGFDSPTLDFHIEPA